MPDLSNNSIVSFLSISINLAFSISHSNVIVCPSFTLTPCPPKLAVTPIVP